MQVCQPAIIRDLPVSLHYIYRPAISANNVREGSSSRFSICNVLHTSTSGTMGITDLPAELLVIIFAFYIASSDWSDNTSVSLLTLACSHSALKDPALSVLFEEVRAKEFADRNAVSGAITAATATSQTIRILHCLGEDDFLQTSPLIYRVVRGELLPNLRVLLLELDAPEYPITVFPSLEDLCAALLNRQPSSSLRRLAISGFSSSNLVCSILSIAYLEGLQALQVAYLRPTLPQNFISRSAFTPPKSPPTLQKFIAHLPLITWDHAYRPDYDTLRAITSQLPLCLNKIDLRGHFSYFGSGGRVRDLSLLNLVNLREVSWELPGNPYTLLPLVFFSCLLYIQCAHLLMFCLC